MKAPTTRRQRVLLIEDDDADAVLVERALERFPGFEMRQVSRLEKALAVLPTEVWDVALLDLSLPDSFGLEGVTTLRSRFPDLPVVVLTGLIDSELPLVALEHGAQDYLCKGQCSPELLVRTIRYAIQREQIQGENRRLLAELARQARHDPLTGLINRGALVTDLEREWQRSLRSQEPLACVMLDLDYFKRINDLHGHAAGDTVLQAVATLARASCRGCDLPGRYGGEEFLFILPGTTEAGAASWAERLRRSIAALPLCIGQETLQVTASFGVAERTADVACCDQLVDRADQGLRIAKQSGRDQVVAFSQSCLERAAWNDSPGDAFAQLTAEEIMTPLVAALDESTPLDEATSFLLNLRLESTPIIDGAGKLVGVLGEEDLAEALTTPQAWDWTVADVMKKSPACFTLRATASSIHDFLSRTGARRVIVLDNQRPVGIVSRASILRWREYHELAGRSRLVELSAGENAEATNERLVALVREIQRQADSIASELAATDAPTTPLMVAGATRLQLLLEDAVVGAQRLDGQPTDRATIGRMLC